MGALDIVMSFKEVYTTQELVNLDTTGKEAKKIKITMDIYALIESLDRLSDRMTQLRIKLK